MQSIVLAERSKVQGIVVNFVDTTMQRAALLGYRNGERDPFDLKTKMAELNFVAKDCEGR